jgi:hypothetical protein
MLWATRPDLAATDCCRDHIQRAPMTVISAESDAHGTVEDQLQRIAVSAAVILGTAAAPGIDSVPERLRGAIVEIHGRLRGIVEALLELQSSYEDMDACRAIALAAPAQGSNLSPYQQLRLAHCRLAQLCSTFDATILRLERNYNEALELLSADEEPIDMTLLVQSVRATCSMDADGPTQQWFAASPSSAELPFLNTLRIASRWPEHWPPFETFEEQIRSELVLRLERSRNEMKTVLAGVLRAHGSALQELVERHGTMMRNFQSQRGAR